MHMKTDYIECGDAVELMKGMPKCSVDVCFTSPPYNSFGQAEEVMEKSVHGRTTHRKYMSSMDRRRDWYEWQCEVIDEMLRVAKKLVIYNVQALANNRKNVYKLIGKYSDKIHDIVIWYKPNGVPTSTKHKISNTYEMLLLIKPNGVSGVSVDSEFYRNIIIQNTNPNREYCKVHRAVMSKSFCDEVIREFTKTGDIVLDPFAGVGTTAISCIEQSRHYIGFDISPEYCDIAKKRVSGIGEQITIDQLKFIGQKESEAE